MHASLIHRRCVALSLIAIGLGGASVAPAIIIRHDKADALYTDLAADAKYASVGQITYQTATSTGTATAVYIGVGTGGKKWLITAAHVLDNNLTSVQFTIAGNTYQVPTASLSFNTNTSTGQWDIGVGQILDPGNTLNVAPAVFTNMTLPVSTDLAARTVATCVGFGQTGNGNAGVTGSDGKKRAMQNAIDCLNGKYQDGEKDLFGYVSDFDKSTATENTLDKDDFPAAGFPGTQKSSRTWLDLEGQASDGDSGGGLFADVSGTSLLIGIESGSKRLGGTNLETYGAYTISTPLDLEMSDDVKRWTGIQGVPEPQAWLALVAGLLVATRRRKSLTTGLPY